MRTTNSKQKILASFESLLCKKSLTKITVSDIVSTANISRGTFYLNYKDKFDLLAQIENKLFSDLRQIFQKYPPHANEIISSDAILHSLYYTQANFALIYALVTHAHTTHVLELLKSIFYNAIGTETTTVTAIYAKEATCDSIASVVILWIKRKAPESPAQLTKLIETLCIQKFEN